MKTIDIRQQSLTFEGKFRERTALIWALLMLVIAVFIAYLFFIHASVYDAIRTQKTNDEIMNLRADLNTLEQEYFVLGRKLTNLAAESIGLITVPKHKIHFVLTATPEKTARYVKER